MYLINKFRTMVQTELTKVKGLTSGKIISDDLIQSETYHYGYEVATSVSNKSIGYDNDYIVINVTGYLTTKGGSLEDFDKYTDEICNALSRLNIRATTKDITTYDTTRKTMITGSVVLNTLDGMLR